MDNSQKISKIKSIYRDFLLKINKLKDEASNRRSKKSEATKQKEIDDILSKINNDF